MHPHGGHGPPFRPGTRARARARSCRLSSSMPCVCWVEVRPASRATALVLRGGASLRGPVCPASLLARLTTRSGGAIWGAATTDGQGRLRETRQRRALAFHRLAAMPRVDSSSTVGCVTSRGLSTRRRGYRSGATKERRGERVARIAPLATLVMTGYVARFSPRKQALRARPSRVARFHRGARQSNALDVVARTCESFPHALDLTSSDLGATLAHCRICPVPTRARRPT